MALVEHECGQCGKQNANRNNGTNEGERADVTNATAVQPARIRWVWGLHIFLIGVRLLFLSVFHPSE